MKLIKRKVSPKGSEPHRPIGNGHRASWKVLVVDDEPDIRTITKLNLKGFQFADKGLTFLEASSGYEAREILRQHTDIAVALIDVVMESDDAGLQLVEFIRQELGDQKMRLVIRTGQPGAAPERYVIDHFDIDDYKDKTELTAARLYTTLRSAIKAYRDIQTIDLNRRGLAKVLDAAPDIYRIDNRSLNNFFEGVLTQIVGLCNLSRNSFISTIDGLIATFDGQAITVQATAGDIADHANFESLKNTCATAVLQGEHPENLQSGAYTVPITTKGLPVGFIYIEPEQELSEADRNLIQVVGQQCSSALENLRLHVDLMKSYDDIVVILARAAEHKDKNTGNHIKRIEQYTRLLSLELGIDADEAEFFGKASRLHDVGKVGIPDVILQKPGKLTPEEFDIIKNHTLIGAEIMAGDDYLSTAREIALHHHERWDGTGYPEGKPSREFALVTRIVSVVDVFDALVSYRPYKHPWTPSDALEALNQGSASQFDPTVIQAFNKLYGEGVFDTLIQQARAG